MDKDLPSLSVAQTKRKHTYFFSYAVIRMGQMAVAPPAPGQIPLLGQNAIKALSEPGVIAFGNGQFTIEGGDDLFSSIKSVEQKILGGRSDIEICIINLVPTGISGPSAC